MQKRILFVLILSVVSFGILFGQSHITRIAVVDLNRVYTEFLKESKAVRELEERAAKVQRDIDKMQNEIIDLNAKLADARLEDKQNEVIRLETEIYRKSEFLRSYYQDKTAQLEKEKGNLVQSASFLSQINNEIRYIAESEGYTNVFNIRNTPGMIWFSPSVDITEKLIQSLRAKSR